MSLSLSGQEHIFHVEHLSCSWMSFGQISGDTMGLKVLCGVSYVRRRMLVNSGQLLSTRNALSGLPQVQRESQLQSYHFDFYKVKLPEEQYTPSCGSDARTVYGHRAYPLGLRFRYSAKSLESTG